MADLNTRQTAAVAAVLQYPTLEEAAVAAGVSARTLRRWAGAEPFRRELTRQRSLLIGDVLTDLARASGDAVKVLRSIAMNKRAPAAPRVQACRAILDLTAKHEENAVLAERVAVLENLVGEGGTNGGGPWQ